MSPSRERKSSPVTWIDVGRPARLPVSVTEVTRPPSCAPSPSRLKDRLARLPTWGQAFWIWTLGERGRPRVVGVVGRGLVGVGLGGQVGLRAGRAVAAVARGELGEGRLALVEHDPACRRPHRGARGRVLIGDAAVDLARLGVADVVVRRRCLPLERGVGARRHGLGPDRLRRPRGRHLAWHDALHVAVDRQHVDRVLLDRPERAAVLSGLVLREPKGQRLVAGRELCGTRESRPLLPAAAAGAR